MDILPKHARTRSSTRAPEVKAMFGTFHDLGFIDLTWHINGHYSIDNTKARSSSDVKLDR